MLRPTPREVETYRLEIRTECESKVSDLIDFGSAYFHTVFPQANVFVATDTSRENWQAKQILQFKSQQIKKLVSAIFDVVEKTCQDEDYDLSFLPEKLPKKIGEVILSGCLRMQVFGRDLTDLDYYLLNDLGKVFGLTTLEIYSKIEQTHYSVRKKLFKELKPQLSTLQKDICAWLMIRAIRADNRVHPAEIKYFEIVTELLDNNQAKLEMLDSRADELNNQLPMTLTDDVAEFLFKYLVEIVMCDKDYNSEESQFIKEIATAFNFDQTKQDLILQPVAAALMVKTDLFSVT